MARRERDTGVGAAAGGGFAARYGALVARVLFSLLLLVYGVMKVRALMGSVQADALQSFPITQIVLYVTILIELAGGVLILIGYKARWAASAVALLFFAVTLLMVPVALGGGPMGSSYLDQILKNLAFIGGLLLLAVHGPGPISIDQRRAQVR